VPAVPLTDIEPLQPLLLVQPLGLFSDIDGTLSPIVELPEDAIVTPRCRELLAALIGKGVAVALITGRRLDVARAMIDLQAAAYAANHGLEFWIDGSTEVAEGVAEYPGLVERILAEAGDLEAAGVHVEKKGPGVAFHYRLASDSEAARAAILQTIELRTAAERFTVLEGRKVFELRPRIEASKGTAARLLAQRLGVKGIVCVGDDRTDVDMFQAVFALREQGIEGRSIAVLSAEVAPDLLAAADYTVDGVSGVEWLLGELVDAVSRAAASGPGTGARATP
jgi:trehalose 6-phosphate phosphatase